MSFSNYIGIPYLEKGRDLSGVDCWGLVRIFYQQEFGIELPSYVEDYKSSTDKSSISSAIKKHLPSWKKINDFQVGDLLIFRVMGIPFHTAIYIGNNDFIHSFKNTNSCVERLNSITWSKRFVGAYRWVRT